MPTSRVAIQGAVCACSAFTSSRCRLPRQPARRWSATATAPPCACNSSALRASAGSTDGTLLLPAPAVTCCKASVQAGGSAFELARSSIA